MGTFHVVMTVLTYPGVLLRMLLVQLLCRVFRCRVSDIRYFSVNPPCCEIKRDECSVPKSFFLCFIPFLVCFAAGLPVLTAASLQLFHLGNVTVVNFILFWFGLSLVSGSLPELNDAKAMWNGIYKNKKSPLAAKILLAPVSAVLYAGGWLFHVGLHILFGLVGAIGAPYLAMLLVK